MVARQFSPIIDASLGVKGYVSFGKKSLSQTLLAFAELTEKVGDGSELMYGPQVPGPAAAHMDPRPASISALAPPYCLAIQLGHPMPSTRAGRFRYF